MAKWKIYHNPRCSKSRQALEILKNNDIEPEVIEYLKEALTVKDLEMIFDNLKICPSTGLRKKEADYKLAKIDLDKPKTVLKAMVAFPKLIERPIVFKGKKGVIARPPEKVLDLI